MNNLKIETERIDWDDNQVVDRVVRQYENFIKAFQKEAIQNAWDARLDKKNGRNWKITFRLHDNNLLIEDYGTTGMDNNKMYAFLSLWIPNKEHLDAGGQGQGKFVLMRGSKSEIIIVESVDEKNNYRCRFLQRGRKSKENLSLKIQELIPNEIPLSHQGTRIWIYDIREDFLQSLYSKEFIDSIIESWWQILGNRFNAEIILFNKKVQLPKIPPAKKETVLLENKPLGNFGRIKRLVLVFHENSIPEIFQGIRIQRANMMITKIPFEVYDKAYHDRFSGYAEFDKDLEGALKDIEKTDHCGFLYQSPWKELKEIIRKHAQDFVDKILPPKIKGRDVNIKNLSRIIQKSNQIINEYCPEIVGKGTFVPHITRPSKPLLYIKYLTVNKREVKFSDTILARCNLINNSDEDKEIILKTELKREGVNFMRKEYKLKMNSKESKIITLFEIELNEENYPKGKYTIRVSIEDEDNRHTIDSKATSFYLEIKRETTKKGFIKGINFFHREDLMMRYISKEKGLIEINMGHKDFDNIWATFSKNKNVLNRQIEFFIIKICLDEAINELLKIKIKDSREKDPDELIIEINEIKDRMYYEAYI